jgi:hypothetical protein
VIRLPAKIGGGGGYNMKTPFHRFNVLCPFLLSQFLLGEFAQRSPTPVSEARIPTHRSQMISHLGDEAMKVLR